MDSAAGSTTSMINLEFRIIALKGSRCRLSAYRQSGQEMLSVKLDTDEAAADEPCGPWTRRAAKGIKDKAGRLADGGGDQGFERLKTAGGSNLVPAGGALEIDNAQTRPPASGRSVSQWPTIRTGPFRRSDWPAGPLQRLGDVQLQYELRMSGAGHDTLQLLNVCPANNRQDVQLCRAHTLKGQMQRLVRVDARREMSRVNEIP